MHSPDITWGLIWDHKRGEREPINKILLESLKSERKIPRSGKD